MNTKILRILDEAGKYGERYQTDGTKLLGHIPHKAPDAWFHVLFSPLSRANTQKLEASLKKEIPPVYKDFLMNEHNGVVLFAGSLSLYGYRSHYDRTKDDFLPFDLSTPNNFSRPRNATENEFFVGSYDWDGSMLYVNRHNSKVCRCDRDDIEPLTIWNNFNTFLEKEVVRMEKFFDKKNGEERNPENPTIP